VNDGPALSESARAGPFFVAQWMPAGHDDLFAEQGGCYLWNRLGFPFAEIRQRLRPDDVPATVTGARTEGNAS
jgi:hypothetical protein